LPEGQLVAHLGVVGVVVVDLDEVVDVDAGLLLESDERRVVAVVGSESDWSVAGVGAPDEPGAQAASARAAAPPTPPASTERRESCEARACWTSLRISGSWGSDLGM
jgi:hypothetical protein